MGQKEVCECVFVCVCLHLKFLNICSLFSVMAAVGMSVCCTYTRVCACVRARACVCVYTNVKLQALVPVCISVCSADAAGSYLHPN